MLLLAAATVVAMVAAAAAGARVGFWLWLVCPKAFVGAASRAAFAGLATPAPAVACGGLYGFEAATFNLAAWADAAVGDAIGSGSGSSSGSGF